MHILWSVHARRPFNFPRNASQYIIFVRARFGGRLKSISFQSRLTRYWITLAGNDSHLLVVPAGNPGMPFAPWAFAELRRVITNQHLSAGFGGGGAIGLTSPTPHKQQGKTLKTTRDATAKSSLQTMNIWVVEEDTLGVLLGCSVVRTPRHAE
ncbi:hypothetical protein IWW34DRAFT_145985 [Fusarium oxysporum f. sp. albedinis]|nr:hypothetical protein IWW34DRAFT_145985 [Fusarium oxysporum f. sp. albedinis]